MFEIVYYTPPCLGFHRQVFYIRDDKTSQGQAEEIAKGVAEYTIPKLANGFPVSYFVENKEDIKSKDRELYKSLDKRYEEETQLIKMRFEG